MRKFFVLLVAAAAITVTAQSPASYHITHRYALGGDGSWDYVVPDPPNHRVFVARQNRLMVIDEENGTLLGEVTGINGAHGTAIAEGTGHGFATSGNDQSVVMFDLQDLQATRPHSRGGGCRRYRLRSCLQAGLHAERRCAFLHRDRPHGGNPDHEYPSGRQTGIRRFGG